METVFKSKGDATSKRVPKLNMLELVTVVNRRYEKALLRREIVPQGFCYACSRIDPGGIFRRPNSYLFKRGFFTACEHFPKAPYTTFVEENPEEDGVIINHAWTETETDDGKRTAAPSISVQIRRSSNHGKFTPSERLGRGSSTENFGRDPSKTNLKSLSSPDKTGRDSSRASFGRGHGQDARGKQSRNSRQTPRLPVITQRDASGTRSYKVSSTKSQRNPSFTRGLTDTSIEIGRLRELSSRLSPEKTPHQDTEEEKLVLPESDTSSQPGIGQTGSIHLPDVRIPVQPAKTHTREKKKPDLIKPESVKSETASRKSGLSPFAKGHAVIPNSAETVELTSGSKDNLTPGSFEQGRPIASSALPNYHTTIINKDDGLNHAVLPVYPVMNDIFGMTARAGAAIQTRPKAVRNRETVTQFDTVSSEIDRESHFLYHHREDGDSVPYPGFEIPPTPTAEELAEIERIEMEQIEAELAEEEKRHLEKLVAEGRVFDTDRSSKTLTDEDSVIISDTGSMTITSISERKSFCRCPTEIRTVGSKQICKHCGKVVGKHGLHNEHKSKSRSGFETEFPFSRSMGSTEVMSRASREKMLKDRKQVGHVRTRTISDEDYMDLESIIQDDDARYWSTDDDDEADETSHVTTTSSLQRLRNAKPYPLVNPDVHKEVYLRALNEVKLREMKKSNETQFDEFKKLRRPNVFSYYRLWPFAGKSDGCSNDLGIRPDNSFYDRKPKKGGPMRHIFGDVKPEDYYPGGCKSDLPRIVLDTLSTDDRSMTKSIDASVINSDKKIKRSGILFAE